MSITSDHLLEGWGPLSNRIGRLYTPERISALQTDEIFIFGSNLKGCHTGGAARTARRVFNAQMGVAEGLTGQAYALPTLDEGMSRVTPEALRESFERLLLFVSEHMEYTFYLTEVGCGIAGWSVETVRRIFWEAVRTISEEAYRSRSLPFNLCIPQRFSLP